MKHYAGLDLSMETTQVCIVDDNGRKVVSEKVESSPEAIAMMLETAASRSPLPMLRQKSCTRTALASAKARES